jgi:hypothetical protein
MRLASGYVCDSCGTDVGNGGIDRCAILAVLGPDGRPEHLHYCYRREDGKKPCAARLLAPSLQERRTKSRRGKPLEVWNPPEETP